MMLDGNAPLPANTDKIITLGEGARAFDGILARTTNPMTMMAKKAGVPIVNV